MDQMRQFGTPAAIFISKDDVLYVAASEPENRVTIGTIDGKVLETIEGLNSRTASPSTRAAPFTWRRVSERRS